MSHVVADSCSEIRLTIIIIQMLTTKEHQASELREGFQSLVRDINSIGLEVNQELRAAERQKNSLFEELSSTLHNLEQLKASFSRLVILHIPVRQAGAH